MDVFEFEPATVAGFVSKQLGHNVNDVTPLGQGAWSRAYAFRANGEELVLRLGKHAEDFEKDQFASRFASPALPIPRVVSVGPGLGQHYAISTRVHGQFLDHLTPEEMKSTLPSLFATLDGLRCADISATEGFGQWDRSGVAPYMTWRQLLIDSVNERPGRTAGWRAALKRFPDAETAFLECHRALVGILPSVPEVRHLVHADLMNRNCFVASRSISGVIDWGCSLYGDFLFDLAWFTFFDPWHGSTRGIDVRGGYLKHLGAQGVTIPEFDARMKACELLIGLSHIAYSAYCGDPKNVANMAARTLEVAA